MYDNQRKNKTCKSLLALCLLLGLSACGGGGDDDSNTTITAPPRPDATVTATSPEQLFEALEDSGFIPELYKSDSLPGPDSNANGIRDDLDAYITNQNFSSNQAVAIQNFAQNLQQIQSAGELDQEVANEIAAGLLIDTMCISDAFSDAQANEYLSKIQGFTANTLARARRYNQFNALGDGSVTRLPTNYSCE